MQAYQAYYKDGRVIPLGKPAIPDGSRLIITVLECPFAESSGETDHSKHARTWRTFLEGIQKVEDDPLLELERVHFREIEI